MHHVRGEWPQQRGDGGGVLLLRLRLAVEMPAV
jgi:hypothetical protein